MHAIEILFYLKGDFKVFANVIHLMYEYVVAFLGGCGYMTLIWPLQEINKTKLKLNMLENSA